MKLTLLHARAITLELLRYPAFSVPTLAFPALFFLLFVSSREDRNATLLVASFAGFALLAVAFFQFGVGIAAERESPWERFLRTLPVPTWVRLAGRLLSGTLFGLVSAGLVALTGVATSDAHLSPLRWAALVAALALGALPFALLGIALGYWASPRGPCRWPTSSTSSWRSPGASGRLPPICRLPSHPSRRSSRRGSSGTCCGARRRAGSGGPGTGCSFWRGARRSPRWLPGGIDATKGGAMAERG
jgi:hypothetical protein